MRDFCNKHKSSLVALLIFAVFSTLFVLFISFSTSPLFPNYYGGDSAQFLTIGKNWTEGRLPYRDLFDHKGPVIFFVNALGFLMGGKSMICIIQIIGLAISLFFLYKICRLATHNKIYIVLAMIFSLIFLIRCYEDGNYVQEYCLPFITASTYFIARFLLNQKQKEHNYKIALLYGISMGVCILTQATNAIPIGAGVLVIMFLLIKNKEFKNLWQNLLAGLIGMAIVFVPFAIYFAANNAFGDFIFATFIYNAEYAGRVGTWLQTASFSQISVFFFCFFGYLCVFPTIILSLIRKKYGYSAFLAIAGALEAYVFFSTQSYPHYAIIATAQLPLFINEIYWLKAENRLAMTIKVGLVAAIALCSLKQLQDYTMGFAKRCATAANPPAIGYEVLVAPYIPDMQKTSALTVGGNPLKDFYLKYNLPVYDKYFAIQGWHARYDPAMKEAIENQYRNTQAKYILMDHFQDFKDIIEQRYNLIGSDNGYYLYRLK